MTNTIRQDAALDQVGAMLRDERKKLLRVHADLQRDKKWFTDPHKLHTLVLYMIDQCGDSDEVRRVVGEVLSKPWNWRAEYVVAKCKQLDTKGGAV